MVKSITLLFILSLLIFLGACRKSHLDIFPELVDTTLMDQKIQPRLLREDILSYYQGTIDRHPNLQKYADKKKLINYVKKLQSQITQPMTRTEFYKIIGQLTHQFNDGHSMLLWPYQEYTKAQSNGDKPFPFEVKITPEKKVLIQHEYNLQNINIASGSQIKSINGTSMEVMLEKMQKYVGGETQYLREQFVANRFALYLWSVFGLINNFEIDIAVTGSNKIISINNTQSWSKIELAKIPKQDFYFKTLDDNIGYLYIRHFDVDPKWFESFVDKSFATIEQNKINSLIIDVRDNTGGNTDTPTYLASYLSNKSFKMISHLSEMLNKDNRGLFNYKGDIGELVEQEWDEWIEPVDSKNRFNGSSYLLISPITYSAGIVFATTLKDNKFATLIGQQTGGNANQTAQGNLFSLPNSQLRAYITTRMLVRPSGSKTLGGVKPHYEVIPTTETITARRDIGIEKAIELINSDQ